MSEEEQSPKQSPSGFAAFWQELKRRHVVRVAMVYAIVGWLVIQVANATFAEFGIPLWAYRFLVLMVVLGFPISVVLAWAFELTPDGIKTTKTAQKKDGESKAHAKKRNMFSLVFAAAVPTLIFGTLAIFFYFRSGTDPSPLDPSPSSPGLTESDKSIAVLPLENQSPDPDNAFFADGVQGDVINNLGKIKDLLVIGRTSTQQYRDTVKTLRQIGEELQVRYLVEGSVRRAGDQVRIGVQLIDSQTGANVWGDTYDRSLDDIFAIQAEVAKQIAGKLQAVILPKEEVLIEQRPTENLDAYDYYVKARQMIQAGGGQGDKKIELLKQAVSRDPNFAMAWAALVTEAIWWWNQGTNRKDTELLNLAHHALNEAKRTGPDLPHILVAQSSIALNEHRDLESSINYLHDALKIDPNFQIAHSRLTQRYFYWGRLSESVHHGEISIRADPYDETSNYFLYSSLQKLGEFERAESILRNLNDRLSGYQFGIAINAFFRTGDANRFIEKLDVSNLGLGINRARRVNISIESALSLIESSSEMRAYSMFGSGAQPKFFRIIPLQFIVALIHFERNEPNHWMLEAEKAAAYLTSMIEDNPKADPIIWSMLSICHALQNDREEMLRTLEKARELCRDPFWEFMQKQNCEFHIAIPYLVLGETEKTLETLEEASQLKSSTFLNRELDLWFIFDRLRGNPRFEDLLGD